MIKVIFTIKEKDLDFILKQILELKIKAIKIKKRIKHRKITATKHINTYNEPDE
ncbi:hypothetical protein [Chryseobacterium arthrosphaerae]|uniref:hypothetical protein n=1 Tax=Chryseobacterium arthrosphaerae TaxID=651561 RepID=UPI001F4A55BD|nr:hypothetical protein [Chryseobacterium arthrosphaerae]